MNRVPLLLLVLVLAYVATGIYFVEPDEQVVVRRFGRGLAETVEPGPHLGLPWGMDRVDRLKPREVKRVTIGPLSAGGEAVGSSLNQLLTGDRNLVLIRATIQYSIADPARYLFTAARVDALVASAGEAELASSLAGLAVDQAMTLGKRELAAAVQLRLQERLDRCSLGVAIRSVDIGAVEPPPEVAEAFDNVVAALRERERQVHLAQGYADRAVAEAQAAAQRTLDEALSYRDRRVLEARGESERFLRLLSEYEQAPQLTAQRLYLEAMEELLPRFRDKVVMDPDSRLDLSILRGEDP